MTYDTTPLTIAVFAAVYLLIVYGLLVLAQRISNLPRPRN